MWLTKSSIGRKVVMSITGIALVLFLTFHASMNVVALFSAKGYNMICEFLGANWYAVVATIALAALVALHFIYAFWLTLQNRKARGSNKYAVTDKPEKVEWASQNMLVLGIIVILGLLLHLYNFWYNMMFAELAGNEEAALFATNGVFHIMKTFSCPVYTVLYLIWLAALWFHLSHGFWSALQTLGWSGKVWFNRWKVIGIIYTTIVILMFAAVALAFSFKYVPADMKAIHNQELFCPDGPHMGCPHEGMHKGCPNGGMHEGCPNGGMHKGCPHEGMHEGCQGEHKGCPNAGKHEGCQGEHKGCPNAGKHEGCQGEHKGCPNAGKHEGCQGEHKCANCTEGEN